VEWVGCLVSSNAYMPSARTIRSLPAGAFKSRGSVMTPVSVRQPNGEMRVTYVESTDPELVDIPCRIAPLFMIRPERAERPTDTGTAEIQELACMLQGLYPQIALEDTFSVDGVPYNVTGNETDGSKIYTRLALRKLGT
jgi:hypothetical protein